MVLWAMEFEYDIERSPLLNTDMPCRFRRRPIDYRELRSRIGIRQVLDLIGWHAATVHAVQLRGPCPLHRSSNTKSRTFSVNVDRDIFRCFKCSRAGNQLDLYAALTDLPLYDAATELCEQLGLDIPYLPAAGAEDGGGDTLGSD